MYSQHSTQPIVSPIYDTPIEKECTIVDVQVKKQLNDGHAEWILFVETVTGEKFRYNLTFS